MAGSAGTGTSTKRFSWPGGATVGSVALGLQTYIDAGSGTDGFAPKMRAKLSPQSSVNSSVWCRSSGSWPRMPSMTSTAPGPGSARCHEASDRLRDAAGSSWVSVWCRSAVDDHDVGVDLVRRAVGVEVADAPCAIVAHDDVGDPGARDEPCAGPLGEAGDAVDHLAESALRVEHPVVEVEVAHQVIQARRRERRGAEEHRRVAEHLAQAGVAHVAGDEAIEALEQQPAESAEAAQHRPREQRRRRREVVVEEVVDREPRGLVGRVEVALERVPGAGFDRLEQGDARRLARPARRPGRGAARSRRGSPDRAGPGRAARPSSCPSGGRSARTPRA